MSQASKSEIFLNEFKANNPEVCEDKIKFKELLTTFLKNEIYKEFRAKVPNLPNDHRQILVIEMMFLSYETNLDLYKELTTNFPIAKEIFESLDKDHLDLLFNITIIK